MPYKKVTHANGVTEVIGYNVTEAEDAEWFRKFGGPPIRSTSVNQKAADRKAPAHQEQAQPQQDEEQPEN